MFKTFMGGTMLASLLVLAAHAQEAPALGAAAEGEMTPPAAAENQLFPPTEGATQPKAAEATASEPALEEGWTAVDPASVSPDTLMGSDIRTYDQSAIAAVDRVLTSPDGKVESIVARFGGLLGFGEIKVRLALDEVAVVRDPKENVLLLTDLSPEALKSRPEFVAPDD